MCISNKPHVLSFQTLFSFNNKDRPQEAIIVLAANGRTSSGTIFFLVFKFPANLLVCRNTNLSLKMFRIHLHILHCKPIIQYPTNGHKRGDLCRPVISVNISVLLRIDVLL